MLNLKGQNNLEILSLDKILSGHELIVQNKFENGDSNYILNKTGYTDLKYLILLTEEYIELLNDKDKYISNIQYTENEYTKLIDIYKKRTDLYKFAFEEQGEQLNKLSKTFEKLEKQKTWKPWIRGAITGFVVAVPACLIGGVLLANNLK